MQKLDKKSAIILLVIGALIMVWLALLLSPVINSNDGRSLFEKSEDFKEALLNPLNISFSSDSIKTVLIFLLIFVFIAIVVKSSFKNKRPGEEHGSAKWGNIGALNRKISNRENFFENMILTQNTSISERVKGHKHRLNLNCLVIGGSGAGKTLFYVLANLLQGNSSYVVLDPKGENLRRTGHFLESKGYVIKVLDLLNMDKSHGYNPFKYIREGYVEEDIQKIATSIFEASAPKGNQMQQDPFWDQTAQMLLKALMLFLYYEAPPEEQNFAMINELLRSAKVMEDDDSYESPVDILFQELKAKNPMHTAVIYYDLYRGSAGKTLKSIQITLIAKIEKFIIPAMERLTMYDELNLNKVGEEKTAIFAIIPENDTSFNFLVSILYTQLFQQIYDVADNKYEGALPHQVHFLMDEFANVALPENFQNILSTIRSRGGNISIIIQALAQCKKLFEKDWEAITANCDETLFLGSSEQFAHEYISKLLGKETIDTNSYGRSRGRNGNYTTNDQRTGRELLTPDEVRLLDPDTALLFIRGQRPIKDKKYDVFHHPNINYTILGSDSKVTGYKHGTAEKVCSTVETEYDGYGLTSIPSAVSEFDTSEIEFF